MDLVRISRLSIFLFPAESRFLRLQGWLLVSIPWLSPGEALRRQADLLSVADSGHGMPRAPLWQVPPLKPHASALTKLSHTAGTFSPRSSITRSAKPVRLPSQPWHFPHGSLATSSRPPMGRGEAIRGWRRKGR